MRTAYQPLHHQQWKPLIIWANSQFIWSGKVYIIDCQSGKKTMPLATMSQQAHACWELRNWSPVSVIPFTLFVFHPSIPIFLWAPPLSFTRFSDTRKREHKGPFLHYHEVMSRVWPVNILFLNCWLVTYHAIKQW